MNNPLQNAILSPYHQNGGIWAIASKRKVWVTWKPRRKRWQVGWVWDDKIFKKYSWAINDQHFAFTEENKGIADQFADYVRSQMVPNRQGICTFDPYQFTRRKRGIYNLDRYFEETFLPKKKAKKRSKQYIKHLERYHRLYWSPKLGELSILDLNETILDQFYYGWLLTLDKSPKQIQNVMDALKQMVNEVFRKNKAGPPEFPDYEKGKKNRKERFLTEEEQDEVLTHVPRKDLPIVTTIFYHGLRLKEARAIKRKDYKDGILYVETLKGGPDREILLEPTVIELIKGIPACLSTDCLFHNNGKPYARSTLTRIIRIALDGAGFSDVWPNEAGRHSGLSNMLRRYPDIKLAQYVAGHADIRTTQRYLHHRIEDQKRASKGQAFLRGQNE